MKKKDIYKRILCGITTCSLGIASLTMGGCSNSNNDLIGNNEYQDMVTEQLDANMTIMDLFGKGDYADDNIVRLRPNSENKIYLYLDDSLSERTAKNVKQVIDEMNELFSCINDTYCFEECDYESYENYKDNNKTVISFAYDELEEKVQGRTISKRGGIRNFNGFKWLYINSSTIYFNEAVFDRFTNDSQLYLITHEFLHTLGFGDIYEDNYKDELSLMNTRMNGISSILSPNDFKMLYVAYGNKHINEDGTFNQSKMDEIKKLIDDYEKLYYEKLMNTLKGEFDITYEDISSDELSNLTFTKNDATITVNNGMYTYIKNGEVQAGKIVVGENYVILPDIFMSDANIIENKRNDFLVLLKPEGGNIECYDVIFNRSRYKEYEEIWEYDINLELN